MAEVGTAFVTILPSTKGFSSKLKSSIGGDLGKAGTTGGAAYGSGFAKAGSSKVKAFAGGIKRLIGPALAVAGTAAAVGFFKSSFDEAREAQKVGAQTGAVLKSTNGVAGVTAKQIGILATAISNKTGIDDEQIQSSENMLLTFTNVRNQVGKGNKIFNQATQTVTDMSAALGQDGKSSAIQLGKALNDPVKGITALSRVGVSFSVEPKRASRVFRTCPSTTQRNVRLVLSMHITRPVRHRASSLPGDGSMLNIASWLGVTVIAVNRSRVR